MAAKEIMEIVDKLPPPDKIRDGGESAEGEGGDYDAGVDSMAAFMKALKGDDPAAALDAYRDVMKNC
jgi:hypothetical protein